MTAAARSVEQLVLPTDLRDADDPSNEVLVAELGGVRTMHTWAEDIDRDLERDPLVASAVAVPGGYELTVVARSLTKDITLLVDRLDPNASVDLGLVDLPAGTSATFRVHSAVPGLEGALTGPTVLRNGNDLAATRPVPAASDDQSASDREVASIG